MNHTPAAARSILPKIIFADDNKTLLATIKSLLEMTGYEVHSSLNAKNIMELIHAKTPDVIVLDIQMNGVNGCELCKELKKENVTRNIPVVMVSANHDLEYKAGLCGADGFLSKPFGMEELISIIDNLMAQRPLLSLS